MHCMHRPTIKRLRSRILSSIASSSFSSSFVLAAKNVGLLFPSESEKHVQEMKKVLMVLRLIWWLGWVRCGTRNETHETTWEKIHRSPTTATPPTHTHIQAHKIAMTISAIRPSTTTYTVPFFEQDYFEQVWFLWFVCENGCNLILTILKIDIAVIISWNFDFLRIGWCSLLISQLLTKPVCPLQNISILSVNNSLFIRSVEGVQMHMVSFTPPYQSGDFLLSLYLRFGQIFVTLFIVTQNSLNDSR